MKNLIIKIANVDIHELLSNLLIVLLVSNGVLRSWDFIQMDTRELENVSPLYVTMANYIDIHALGWLFMLFSITLLISIFFKGQISYIFMVLGALGAGVIHIIFGIIATEGAVLFITYYFMLLCGVIQFILVIVGGTQLWKIKQLKK
ncbi:hypothetical protein JTF04_02545 [Mammaliicoccus vitulinus]|uniref:hypothetical protein n=1 Tax=Mammaliicoccus vitulinus TaxID=71237 RepID=UPI00194EFBDE|nr:hypothetical protein [Mammaliicoccus vitulinus]MBM6628547.1 hypothetical protein [Mammaliicoccus vitulinus]